MKFIRWLLFIPLSIALIGVIQIGVLVLFNWVIGWDMNIFLQALILVVLGGIIWGVFKTVSFMFSLGVISISPNLLLGAKIFEVFSSLMFLAGIVILWYQNWGHFVFLCIIITVLNLSILRVLYMSVDFVKKKEFENEI